MEFRPTMKFAIDLLLEFFTSTKMNKINIKTKGFLVPVIVIVSPIKKSIPSQFKISYQCNL